MKADLYSYNYNSDTKVLTIYEGAEAVLCTIPEVEIDESETIFVETVWDLREVDVSNN